MKLSESNISGFTLIEAMGVIVVLAIIGSIALPMFVNMTVKAKQAATKGYMATMRSVTNIYYGDNMYYPYQNSVLPNSDSICNYDTITAPEQKNRNAWVPKYMSDWPQAIRISLQNWKSSNNKVHENSSDMRIVDITPNPKPQEAWDEEIIYNCKTGEIYLNCNLTDKDGNLIYEW